VVGENYRAVPVDPSLQGSRIGAKLGFDCTKPFNKVDAFEFTVAAPPVMPERKRQDVETLLASGPASFLDMMAALGTRDGREILPALDKLYAEGRIARLDDGRYALNGAGKKK
jgi:hypothetical protein